MATPLMDINARMPAPQPAQRNAQAVITVGNGFPHARTTDVHIHTTGAAQIELAPFLGIEIQQQAAAQPVHRQTARAPHAGFLVHRQQGFQRPVGQRRVFQCRQDQRHADAVIGAQRRPLGNQPTIVAQCRFDRVAGKVVCSIGVALADHVQMRLQHHARCVFIARRGRLADQQIADSVDLGRQPKAGGPSDKVVTQRPFALRGTGNGA